MHLPGFLFFFNFGDRSISVTPSESHTDKEGYLVDLAAGVATISSSDSVPAKGVILRGADTTDGKDKIGHLGSLFKPVPLRAGGTITALQEVQQGGDGRVVADAGSGDRLIVGVALGDAVAGDLFQALVHTPVPRN